MSILLNLLMIFFVLIAMGLFIAFSPVLFAAELAVMTRSKNKDIPPRVSSAILRTSCLADMLLGLSLTFFMTLPPVISLILLYTLIMYEGMHNIIHGNIT